MTEDGRIVDWAESAAHIGLRCRKCGALFHTKNLHFVGARQIFMSMDIEGLKKCLACDEAGHTLDDLEIIEPKEGSR